MTKETIVELKIVAPEMTATVEGLGKDALLQTVEKMTGSPYAKWKLTVTVPYAIVTKTERQDIFTITEVPKHCCWCEGGKCQEKYGEHEKMACKDDLQTKATYDVYG